MARLDYFAPGVYVEEVDRGSRPIEGISMSVAGFVGLTEDIRGGAQRLQPMLVSNWNQYLDYFARPGSNGFTDFHAYLPFAVRGWFENGGGRCWVVSLGTQLPNGSGEQSNANGAAQTPFSLANATIIPTVSAHPSLSTSIKPERTDLDRVSMIIEPDVPRPFIEHPAIERSTDESVDDVLFDPEDKFQIKVIQGERILEGPYRHLSMDSEVDPTMGEFVGTALQASSIIDLAILADQGSPLWQKPANGIYEVAKYELVPHADLDRDISGQRSDRTGIRGLFEIDEVSMIACPDLMLAHREGLINLDQVHSIMDLMITGCETAVPSPKYRMAVLDLPPVQPDRSARAVSAEQQKPQHAMQWLNEFGRRSDMAAIYYPWIKVANPRDQGRPILVPPCGHMMGIWCHTDETRGVHKAPANVQPRGVIGMAYEVNFREQELLNPLGINCIRRFPNRGIRVWGARTLIEPDNVQWRYISVRRLMSYIEKSIELGTQWAVFEPNDEDLWARVTRTVSNFLERIWREGALFGSSPAEAFYVKCDAELNTPETMMLGRLYVEVGVSPVRPAEFVIFRISQWAPNQ
jgi:hypothetical protein